MLALAIGLGLVHLETAHRQAVYQVSCLRGEEQQLERDIQRQRELIAATLEAPEQIKERIARMKLELYRPGESPEAGVLLAQGEHNAPRQNEAQ